MSMTIPITKAVIDESEMAAIIEPLKSGWLVQGPKVARFEKAFCQMTKAQYAKAVSSCTTALHLALDALGIGVGDKVVVPSFTYVASANAVTYCGAEVVFCDIDLDTFNINIDMLESLLANDKSIKAIMPVHLFGLCADMPKIMSLANLYQVNVVEDAACAIGSYIGETHAGLFADAGCFSFHPRKAITTGEGGMVICENEDLFSTIKQLCDHGAQKSDLERHLHEGGSLLPDFSMRGYNYRMTDLQGALGVCQMQKARDILSQRQNMANRYQQDLSDIKSLQRPSEPQGYTHSYQSFVCLYTEGQDINTLCLKEVDALNQRRNQKMLALEKRGIATRQGTHAVHTLSYYQNRYKINDSDIVNAYKADRLSVTLPLYAGMTDEEYAYVMQHLQEVL